MKPRLGMSPQELVEVFNETYLESWGEMSEKLRWDVVKGGGEELGPFLLELMEAVVNAARDGAVMAIYENNERVIRDLASSGLDLSGKRG